MTSLLRIYDNTKMSSEEKEAGYDEVISGRSNFLFAAAVAMALAPDSGKVELTELQYAHKLEIVRTDKQLGASSTSSASTSAVEKPGIAQLLGLAVESGAITKKEDKSGVTLSTSPYSLLTVGVPDTRDNYEKYDLLRRLGMSATFSLDDGGSKEDQNFDASALTEISAKYVLWGDRSSRSKDFDTAWKRNVLPYVERRATADAKLAAAVAEIDVLRLSVDRLAGEAFDAVRPRLQVPQQDTKRLVPVLKGDIQGAVDRAANRFDPKIVSGPEKAAILEAAQEVVVTRKKLGEEDEALKAILDDLEKSPEVTAAYTFHRKKGDADYSEVKILAEYNTALVTFVGNANISINHDRSRVPLTEEPATADMPADKGKKRDTVREYSISLSLEKKIPNFLPFRVNAGGTNEIMLSLSGKLLRLEDENDEIGVGQAKASFPLATGVDLPISVTYATRSEYVDEDEIRGNFGISVDTDKLWSFAKLATGAE